LKKNNTFPKAEKLCGEIRIDQLYKEGKAFMAFPMRVVYAFSTEKSDTVHRLVISVPKKRFKKAVDRNRIKRLIKECYRLQKHELIITLENSGLKLRTGINIITDKMPEYPEIYSKMTFIISKLTESVQQKTFNNTSKN
jgi:ribonuclease P protein component